MGRRVMGSVGLGYLYAIHDASIAGLNRLNSVFCIGLGEEIGRLVLVISQEVSDFSLSNNSPVIGDI